MPGQFFALGRAESGQYIGNMSGRNGKKLRNGAVRNDPARRYLFQNADNIDFHFRECPLAAHTSSDHPASPGGKRFRTYPPLELALTESTIAGLIGLRWIDK